MNPEIIYGDVDNTGFTTQPSLDPPCGRYNIIRESLNNILSCKNWIFSEFVKVFLSFLI